MRDHAVATTSVNILDWTSAYEFAVTTDELQRLAVPSLVLYGAVSNRYDGNTNNGIGGLSGAWNKGRTFQVIMLTATVVPSM